jgi:hypothetical protein
MGRSSRSTTGPIERDRSWRDPGGYRASWTRRVPDGSELDRVSISTGPTRWRPPNRVGVSRLRDPIPRRLGRNHKAVVEHSLTTRPKFVDFLFDGSDCLSEKRFQRGSQRREITREGEPGQVAVDLVVPMDDEVAIGATANAHSTPSGARTPSRESRLAASPSFIINESPAS